MTEEIESSYALARKWTPETLKRAKETRTVSFVASTSDKDRHGTVLNQSNWKLDNFRLNPVVGYQHNVYGGDMCNAPDPDDIIGRGNVSVQQTRAEGSEQLIIDITFEDKDLNEKADKIFRKVLNGTLNAVSVGFSPIADPETNQFSRDGDEKAGEDPTAQYFYGQELLETSVVNIPSNAQAVKKSLRGQTSSALIFIKRQTGLAFSDIEKMTVANVIDLLEKDKELPEIKGSWTETTAPRFETPVNGQFQYVGDSDYTEAFATNLTQLIPDLRTDLLNQNLENKSQIVKLKTKTLTKIKHELKAKLINI